MNKGLASFEFLITLALILLITTVLITTSLEQSKDTMVMSTAKSLTTQGMSNQEIDSETCENPIIESYEVQESQLTLNVVPDSCKPGEKDIANKIEEEICGANPDNNNRVTCGERTYEVNIE